MSVKDPRGQEYSACWACDISTIFWQFLKKFNFLIIGFCLKYLINLPIFQLKIHDNFARFGFKLGNFLEFAGSGGADSVTDRRVNGNIFSLITCFPEDVSQEEWESTSKR